MGEWDVDGLALEIPFALYMEWMEFFTLRHEEEKKGTTERKAYQNMKEAQSKVRKRSK